MGGPIMWFIFVGSVIAFGVFIERLLFYHRCSVPIGAFLKGVRLLIQRKKFDEVLERCDEAYGPSIKVVQSAVLKRSLSKGELREVIQEVAQLQVPRLEANLAILSTVAHVMPLLGLFGTVTGMIQAFMEMTQASGATPIGQLAGGIWEALVTTAGGLGVAIPAYVAYNFLNGRVNSLVSDMERAGIEVLQMLKDPEVASLEEDLPPKPESKPSSVKVPSGSKGDGDLGPKDDKKPKSVS